MKIENSGIMTPICGVFFFKDVSSHAGIYKKVDFKCISMFHNSISKIHKTLQIAINKKKKTHYESHMSCSENVIF